MIIKTLSQHAGYGFLQLKRADNIPMQSSGELNKGQTDMEQEIEQKIMSIQIHPEDKQTLKKRIHAYKWPQDNDSDSAAIIKGWENPGKNQVM